MTPVKKKFLLATTLLLVVAIGQFAAHSGRSLFDGLASVVSMGLVFVFFSTGQKLWAYWKLETEIRNKMGLLVCLAVAAVTVYITWPGALGIDDLFILEPIKAGAASGFHSISYSALLGGLYFLTGHDFMVCLINMALYAQLLVILFSCTLWEKNDPFFWLFVGILLMPQTLASVFFQNRDSTYTLLLLVFLFAFFMVRKGRFPSLNYHLVTLVFLGCVLGEMRQEGKFITLATPFLAAYFYQKNRRQVLGVGLGTLVTAFLLQWGLPTVLDADTYNPVYKVTALINPLSHMIHVHGPQVLSPEEKEKVEKLINVENLIRDYSPYDIVPFHKGGLKHPVAPETFAEVRNITLKLIFEHPKTYLESRWNFFIRLFNFERAHNIFWDEKWPIGNLGQTLLARLGISDIGKKTEGQRILYEKVVPFLLNSLPQPWHFLFSSGFFPLLTITLVTVFFRKIPEFGFLGGLLLLRTLILVPLVPANLFKYVSSIWVGGWMLGLIYINQERKRIFKNF